MEMKRGCLAKSLAGHDKDEIYVILSVDANVAYVADGRLKTISAPKKKKCKHLQGIGVFTEALDRDEEIKRAIKEYKLSLVSK
ncbi:MAG: KOW domain-containing RNA-binding protein [Lachnospiraceae bacterium]|nr:KOW domain-containing RNA-binding protein [Lachnospiraceae bacterium]